MLRLVLLLCRLRQKSAGVVPAASAQLEHAGAPLQVQMALSPAAQAPALQTVPVEGCSTLSARVSCGRTPGSSPGRRASVTHVCLCRYSDTLF